MPHPQGSELSKRFVWGVVLTVLTVASSLAIACGTPFVALAAIGALFLPRRDAILLIAANWLANQAIGFALLHYPHTWDCYLGGLNLLVGAEACAIAAMLTNSWLRNAEASLKALVTFAVAFASYEGLLFAITPSAHVSDFAAPIVAYIFYVNSIAFVGLLLLKTIAARLGFAFPLVASPHGPQRRVPRYS
jgi:hypothetical protein